MTVGVMSSLTKILESDLKCESHEKWRRLLALKRYLLAKIDNNPMDCDYHQLMLFRVEEELGHMIREGEVA